MSLNPIEGVDYIFDRYAYLKLEVVATKDEIHKAIKLARAAVHADRMQNVHPDIVAKADGLRKLIDDCAAVLEDDGLRPLYTERLQEFYRDKPTLVSATGNAIIDMSAERTDLEFLLRGDKLDFDQLKANLQQMSGYAPKQVAAAKKLYAVDSSEENRDLLESALTTQFVYYTLLEETAWSAAGINGFKKKGKGWLLDPADYIAQVETEIKNRHEGLKDVVSQRSDALRIGVGAPILLLAAQSGVPAEHKPGQALSTVVAEQLTQKAQEVFSERAALIREIAAEKQQTLAELIGVTFIQDLGIPLDKGKPYALFLFSGDGNVPETPVLVSVQTDATATLRQFGDAEHATPTTVAEAKALGIPGCIIRRNPEITDAMLPFAEASNRFLKRLEEAPYA